MTSAPASHHAHQPDRLVRVIVASVGWTIRHPWLVLAACLALAGAGIYLANARLEYHTQRNDLLSADKPCQKRWQKYLDAFGDDDDMVVVVEGKDHEKMKAALDAVADRVKQRPDLFDRVSYRIDLRNIHDRAILFLTPEQVEGVRGRVDRMEPLLGSLSLISWKLLSLQSLLSKGAIALETESKGGALSEEDRDLLSQLPSLVHVAADSMANPASYRNPWSVAGPPTADRGSESQLTEPQYFFTPDGAMAVLLCRPKKASDSFTPAKEANEAMRSILADVRPGHPELKLGLTGLPVLETDEMDLSDLDSERASWLALIGVAVLYFLVYRGFRFPLLTVLSLVVGTIWALGWATVTVGHLNILSSTFAVMLIGMGDYGVLWVARYDEGRRDGQSMIEAMQHTAAHAGPSIVTAALTTALAFFATMLADFKAVAELGWIAGFGVIFCALSCLTLMPATLAIVERIRDRRSARRSLKLAMGSPVDRDHDHSHPTILLFPVAPVAWLPGLAGRPRWVLGAGAILLAGCALFAGRLDYDHNLLNLQPRGLESVAWEQKLIENSAGATWDALSIAKTREEARALKAKYEAVPEVGRVVEAASLLPPDQDRKLPAVRAIRDRLAGLAPADQLPTPLGSSPAVVRIGADHAAKYAGAHTDLAEGVRDLIRALKALPFETASARLQEFDRRLAADLAADLHRLKAVSRPAPILLADLPADLRDRYVGANGEYLVRAYARDSLWDYDALRRFTTAAATADPEATGKAFRTLEGLRQMKIGFEWAGVYALTAIVLVLLLDFRRVGPLLLGLFPLAVGVVMTLGVMGLFGLSLNPANMIALPLIVGVGIDNGVHVLHDYRARQLGRAYTLGPAVGKGVLIAALTTILGFGTLLIARHRGMASLGLALTLGVTFCMVASLILLPALLRVLDERRLRKPVAEQKVLKLERGRRAA